MLSRRLFILRFCIFRFNAEQTISSRFLVRAGGSWALHRWSSGMRLVVTPSMRPRMAWLGIGISASTEFTRFYIAPTCYNVTMPKAPFKRKICPSCDIDKPREDYYKKLNTVSYLCKQCSNARCKERASRYFGKYAAYQNEWRSTRYATDPAYREKIAQQKKASYEKRRDTINEARRERWANDPLNPARLYYRRKDVKNCTPVWASKDELLAVYANCPKGMEVDHVIPLKGLIDGRRVCGLHVPWNLQYLTPRANRVKKNRISESDLATFSLKR